MIYPKLVIAPTTSIHVLINTNEIDENGAPIKYIDGDLLCNYQSGGKIVKTSTGQELKISGIAYFDGDITPELAIISSGTAVVHGDEFQIVEGRKSRNLDGSVNFTELWLL